MHVSKFYAIRQSKCICVLVNFTLTRLNCFHTDEHFSNSFIDINECQWNTHECHDNASCTNTVGDYNCTCKAGFSGDGFDCQGKVNLSSS